MTVVSDLLQPTAGGSLHDGITAFLTESRVSTCAIMDALDGLGVPNAALDSRLTGRSAATAIVCGAAYPVSWAAVRKSSRITDPGPSTWSEVRDFVVPGVTDGRGQIYVAGAGPLITEAALAGGISLTYLIESLRFEGVVLGGAVRDREVVESLPSAVVASNFIPTDTQGSYRVVAYGSACLIGQTLVTRGDWVFHDGNGTVIVPKDLLGPVLAAAAEIEANESLVIAEVRAGRSLPELIDEIGQI